MSFDVTYLFTYLRHEYVSTYVLIEIHYGDTLSNYWVVVRVRW